MGDAVKRRNVATGGFLLGLIALYVFGIVAIHAAPTADVRAMLAGYAFPFDCMVVLPTLFYFLVIRRNGLSPLFVLPVMWAGGALATLFAQGSDTTLIATLAVAGLAVEATIAVREIIRIITEFRRAKAFSDEVQDWFFAPLMKMTGNARLSKLASKELVMFYYTFFSWKRVAASSDTAFSYHKDSGYGAAIAGLMLAVPVETVVVHMLVAQWSDIAAWILTLSSVYAVFWLIADYRASVLRPFVFENDTLKIRSGMRFEADIPLASIASYEKEMPEIDKKKLINLGMMGIVNGWLVFDAPIEVETVFGGKKEIEAIGVAVDDHARFSRMIGEAISE